jgi:small GTP-binding protein
VATITKKVCLLGDFAVGKTSLVRRFVYSVFEDRYLATIGVRVSRKVLHLADGATDAQTTVMLMLWDMAGSDVFTRMRASYLRGAAGVVLVCDLTRPETLPSLNDYTAILRDLNLHIPLILAANKCDLTDQMQLSTAELEDFVTPLAAPLYLTSAKDDIAVDAVFEHLGRLMLHRDG